MADTTLLRVRVKDLNRLTHDPSGRPKDSMSSSPRRWPLGGRRALRRGSRTISGSHTGSPAASWPGRRCCRRSKFGARLVSPRSVTSLSQTPGGFRVRLDDHNDIAARAVVVASGVQYRRLEIPGVEEFRVAASTTPRLSSRHERASARTPWWWEAPTRPAKPRCSSRSMWTRCTSSSGGTTSPRRCPAISRNDSLTMTGSSSTRGHT